MFRNPFDLINLPHMKNDYFLLILGNLEPQKSTQNLITGKF